MVPHSGFSGRDSKFRAAIAEAQPAAEDGGHPFGDGKLDPCTARRPMPARSRRLPRRDPLARHLAGASPRPKSDPQRELRELVLVAVSTRSPRPDKPSGFAARPSRAEAHQLGEASRDPGRASTFLNRALHHAASNGVTFLPRRQRNPDEISRWHRAKAGPAQTRLQARRWPGGRRW